MAVLDAGTLIGFSSIETRTPGLTDTKWVVYQVFRCTMPPVTLLGSETATSPLLRFVK